MSKDVDHSKKLREIDERQNRYLARRVEEHDVGVSGSSAQNEGATEGGLLQFSNPPLTLYVRNVLQETVPMRDHNRLILDK